MMTDNGHLIIGHGYQMTGGDCVVRWCWVNFQCRGVLRFGFGGGRVVRRCWVNFQCRGVLLIWMRVGQGPTALAVGAGGGCLDFFSLVYHFSFLAPSFWETARYRLKYCLKGPLSQKQPTNQPTNDLDYSRARAYCACSRCGWGFIWTFLFSSILSFLFLPLFGRRSDID